MRKPWQNPLNSGEVYTALASGSNWRAPGIDGLESEFYLYHWALLRDVLHAVLNQMFWKEKMKPLQKRGIIICLTQRTGTTIAERFPASHTPKQ
jgi:hypothetical protein